MAEESQFTDDGEVRPDGKKYNEIRPMRIKAGVLKRADGSAYIEWGGNKIIAAVYGPREVGSECRSHPARAIVRCRYDVAAFSVAGGRYPQAGREERGISKVMSEAFEEVILTERFPRSTVDIFVKVLQEGGGPVCAAVTASSVALANAGIPMKDLIPACTAGKSNGRIVLDPSTGNLEDNGAVVSVAIMPRTGEIILLRMDGKLSASEFGEVIKLVSAACMEIYEIQKKALKDDLVSEFSLSSMKDGECQDINVRTGSVNDPEEISGGGDEQDKCDNEGGGGSDVVEECEGIKADEEMDAGGRKNPDISEDEEVDDDGGGNEDGNEDDIFTEDTGGGQI